MSSVRHILSLSGGKDSTALAIYLHDRIPDLEYVFCDTRKELPETYEYLHRVEAFLGRHIEKLDDGRGFDHWFEVYRKYLPSSRSRWCTRHLKIQPFERYIGDDPVRMYIGIRADEDREGYISHKANIEAVYPFKEDGLVKQDILEILDRSGLGLPRYYDWRSRSGCFFCFFQQKVEWVGLLENHPDRFAEAVRYEELSAEAGCDYNWSQGESLKELSRPERITEIKAEHLARMAVEKRRGPNRRLVDVFAEVVEGQDDSDACMICSL